MVSSHITNVSNHIQHLPYVYLLVTVLNYVYHGRVSDLIVFDKRHRTLWYAIFISFIDYIIDHRHHRNK